MENFENLRKIWQKARTADNQELLAMVENSPKLDERTQIFISQRGEYDVLLALFNQEDLCLEAKYYLAKRGNEKVHLLLLNDENIPNSVQEILAEKGSIKVLQKLTNTVKVLSSNSEFNILDRDDEAFKTLSNLEHLTPFCCRRLVNEASSDVIIYFLQKDDIFLKNELLSLISEKRDEIEIHQCILELIGVPEEVLLKTVKKCDTSLLPIALNKKGISNEVLYQIANRIDVCYFDEILQMVPFFTNDVLVVIAQRGTSKHLDKLLKFKYLDGKVQEFIIKRGDTNQIFSVMEREDFAEAAMLAVVKTKNSEFISVLISGGNIPPSVQTAVAELDKDMYNKELIKANTLSARAQEKLAKTKKREYMLAVLKRDDICDKAVNTIAEYCFKKSMNFVRKQKDLNEDVTKEECAKAILQLKKISPEAQVLIARTNNPSYIIPLLAKDKVCDKALEIIAKYDNPQFNRIIKARFDYTV